MCGILGSVNIPLAPAVLDLLAHRGPDGEGLVVVPVGSHQVSLGHRRLAIVDLSENGRQPMASPDQRQWLVYNGEIYNHAALRTALQGASFRGHSDTETLLATLEGRGVRSLADFNGIFAFAWLNVAERKLFLVRDPFGVKPLYYFHGADRLAFASELRPLLAIAPRELDRENLATLLKLRFSPSPDTLFKGIRKLPPGHALEIDLAGPQLAVREHSYVRPLRDSAAVIPAYPEAVRRYGELFGQAVERQLMSDVEVGILLSGGIDSALVAAAAQQRSSRPLKAFTVGFTGAEAGDVDEIADARETAAFLGMEHHAGRMGFVDFLATLQECVRVVEEPLATTSIVPMHYLARLASQQVKVVLSGQGADELLGGYTRYQSELYRRFVPPSLARAAGTVAGWLGARSERLTRGLGAIGGADDVERFLGAGRVFSDRDVTALIGPGRDHARERIAGLYAALGCAALPASIERIMALDLRFGLADDLLLYTDKITMQHSLECRVPILDHELVRFIESLPYKYRVSIRKKKIIHRDYAAGALPPAIIRRRKKGFLSPTRHWFRDAGALGSVLLNRGSRFATVFDLAAVDSTIQQHGAGFNRERHIFLLLCLYYWCEEFL
ncbi:MAG: asparagine synthase (glutamine-hydrolyzing) [Chromatiales bacterium]|nr:asparagine synthase (glutamine-hydrolyzing) [Chromatiales bacterium]